MFLTIPTIVYVLLTLDTNKVSGSQTFIAFIEIITSLSQCSTSFQLHVYVRVVLKADNIAYTIYYSIIVRDA